MCSGSIVPKHINSSGSTLEKSKSDFTCFSGGSTGDSLPSVSGEELVNLSSTMAEVGSDSPDGASSFPSSLMLFFPMFLQECHRHQLHR